MIGQVIVVNKRVKIPPSFIGVYVGRPSILGNPFVLTPGLTRESVIEKYKEYLENKLDMSESLESFEFKRLLNLLQSGEKIALVCWCAPKSCHADVIKRKLEDSLEIPIT